MRPRRAASSIMSASSVVSIHPDQGGSVHVEVVVVVDVDGPAVGVAVTAEDEEGLAGTGVTDGWAWVGDDEGPEVEDEGPEDEYVWFWMTDEGEGVEGLLDDWVVIVVDILRSLPFVYSFRREVVQMR